MNSNKDVADTRNQLMSAFNDFKESQFNEALLIRRVRLRELQQALHEHIQACRNAQDSDAKAVSDFIAPLAG